jgi:hypothetical protein
MQAAEEIQRQRELEKIPKGCRFMTNEEQQTAIADVVRNRPEPVAHQLQIACLQP